MAEQQKQYITPETKAKLEAELQALIDHRPVVAAVASPCFTALVSPSATQ